MGNCREIAGEFRKYFTGKSIVSEHISVDSKLTVMLERKIKYE